MDRRTTRIVLVIAGVIAFGVAAASAFGWIHDGNASGWALVGFGCWLASTLP